MNSREPLPSASSEDYLKQILLGEEGEPSGRVTTGALAQALGVTPGSVTARMKLLAEAGWIEYEAYSGARLTPAGRRVALEILRRHRLLERFLVEIVGFDWAEVHEEAERLEHAVSERFIARIDALLGHPRSDPHGDPIPTPTGHVETPLAMTLATAPLEVPVRLVRTGLQDPPFLRWLERNCLVLGAVLVVEERDPLAATLKLRLLASGRQAVLAEAVATSLWVQLLDADAHDGGNLGVT